MTREEVASGCGVSVRTVSRWADQEILTKYLDVMHRVVFDAEQVARIINTRLSTVRPPAREEPRPAAPTSPRRPRRW